MDLIDKVGEMLHMSREEVEKNSEQIDENMTYFWQPERGGLSLVTDKDGNYLGATSGVNPEKLFEEFRNGRRAGNLFNE